MLRIAFTLVGGSLLLFSPASLWPQSLTVSLSGNQVQWSTATGNSLIAQSAANPGSNTITVTTTWSNLNPGGTDDLALYAYFNSSGAALVHQSLCLSACSDVPASAIEVGINGAALLPINQTCAFGAASACRRIFVLNITGSNRSGSRADVLRFNINLSTLPQLPADTYSGTLFIQAQAI